MPATGMLSMPTSPLTTSVVLLPSSHFQTLCTGMRLYLESHYLGRSCRLAGQSRLAREHVSQLPQQSRNVKCDAQMPTVDFVAVVRKLRLKKLGLHTIGDFAESISNSILATGSESTRIDIFVMFIKNHQSSKWNGPKELMSCLSAVHALSGFDSTSKVGPKLSGVKVVVYAGGLVWNNCHPDDKLCRQFFVPALKKTDCSNDYACDATALQIRNQLVQHRQML
ncbi:hypothetical protein GQR58_011842 [Nymphon striatum]|nr:hypothetical protein GQR58_011842 [Nymphon striatum]